MLKMGIIIERVFTDWASAVVVVPKGGPGDNMRLCVDFRDVNDVTRTVKYPLPNIEDIV